MSAAVDPHPDASAVSARRSAEDFLSRLPAEPREGDRGFNWPWELRAFALAVAAHETGQYRWAEFQAALIQSIRKWEEKFGTDDPSWLYYEHWVTALEAVLADSATLDLDALHQHTQQVLCTPTDRHDQVLHREPVAIDPAIPPA